MNRQFKRQLDKAKQKAGKQLSFEVGTVPGPGEKHWPAIQLRLGADNTVLVNPSNLEDSPEQAMVLAGLHRDQAFAAREARPSNMAPVVAVMGKLTALGYQRHEMLMANPIAQTLVNLASTTLRDLAKIPNEGFSVTFNAKAEIEVRLHGEYDNSFNRSMADAVGHALLTWTKEAQEVEDDADGDSERFLFHLVAKLNELGLDLADAGKPDA